MTTKTKTKETEQSQWPPPPQDLGAEMNTLAAGFLDRDILGKIIQIVKSNHFNRQDHRLIFNALTDLYENNKPVDLVILRDELDRRGQLEQVGGGDYLAKLVNSVPDAANGPYYAGIVQEAAQRRQLIIEAVNATKSLYDITADIDDTLSTLSEAIKGTRSSGPGLITIAMSEVESKSVIWLWDQRIAIGKLTVLAGDPGLGKSFVTLDIAATVSTGRAWPDDQYSAPPTGSVLIFNAEDGIGDTIKPRLESMGADMEQIHCVQSVQRNGKERCFDLSNDLAHLGKTLETMPDCKLVIIDPVSAYMGQTDSHNNSEVRGALAPLSELADRHNVAVLAVSHLNKGAGTNPVYRVTGSLAFTAAARAVWIITQDDTDEDYRLLLPVKNNLAHKSRNGLRYATMNNAVVWAGTVDQTARGHFKTMAEQSSAPTKFNAKKWILEFLEEYGPQLADDFKDAAENYGFNWKTIQRAKEEMNGRVKVEKTGYGGKWQYRLSDQEPLTTEESEE